MIFPPDSIPETISDSAIHNAAAADSSFRFSDIYSPSNPTKPKEIEETNTYVPFFHHHELPIKNQEPIPITSSNPFWLFYVLLILVAGFTWVKVFYSRTLEHILGSFISKTMSNQVVRDENLLLQKASFLLTGIFYLVLALFIYQISILDPFLPDFFPSGIARFLILAVMVAAIYSFKFIFLKVSGFIFQLDKPVSAYIFNIFLINNLIGILLLPVVIAISFTSTMAAIIIFKITVAIIILLYLFRLMRGILIGLSLTHFSLFYLFLYICALEIAPLIFIIKATIS